MLFRLIRAYLRPYHQLLWILVALQFVATIASLYLPSLNGRIIDEGVAALDTGRILSLGAIMLAVTLVQIATTICATYLAARSATGLAASLRAAVFGKVVDFSDREMSAFGPATLISRSTNDVQQVQMLTFMSLAMMVTAPIMMVGGLIMAVREDAGLSWLIVVVIPLMGLIVGSIMWRMVPGFRRMQTSVDSVNRILREQITGLRVVRAFVREDVERERFAEANTAYTDSALYVGRLMAMAMPTVMLIFNLSSVAVLWFGAHRVDSGAMQIGQLTAFLQYLMQVLMAVMMTVFMATMVPRASVSAARISEVLDTPSSLVTTADPTPLPPGEVSVEFDDVTFTYPGAQSPVLQNVSFTAKPGTVTAIIGSTGAGKTTLINLIPRLMDVSDGSVRVGGVDVRTANLDELWSRMGMVPQKAYLFSGTVGSTVRHGRPDATDDEVWAALRIAQADDFVRAMPGGLDAQITQGGTNVSGGQRQRLAIARAVLRRPAVYVFDDAFSALDVATDARLREALVPQTREATVIVVAQRVSTITQADQIVVLEDGRVVGIGTHEELLARGGTYAEIVASQDTQGALA